VPFFAKELFARLGIDEAETFGQFGDAFGSVNALFTGLAFLGVVITLWFQWHQSVESNENSQRQLEHIESQLAELRKQNNALHAQSLDNTFFNLIRLRNDIVNGFIYKGPEGSGDGWAVFSPYFRELNARYRNFTERGNDKDNIKGLYDYFWEKRERDLGHHWNTLDSIFDALASFPSHLIGRYVALIDSQLTPDERRLYFYFCAARGITWWQSALPAKFGIFDGLEVADLLYSNHEIVLKKFKERSRKAEILQAQEKTIASVLMYKTDGSDSEDSSKNG